MKKNSKLAIEKIKIQLEKFKYQNFFRSKSENLGVWFLVFIIIDIYLLEWNMIDLKICCQHWRWSIDSDLRFVIPYFIDAGEPDGKIVNLEV